MLMSEEGNCCWQPVAMALSKGGNRAAVSLFGSCAHRQLQGTEVNECAS